MSVWRIKRKLQCTGFDLSKIKDPGKYLSAHARAMKGLVEVLRKRQGQTA
jgi:hypothetical protein